MLKFVPSFGEFSMCEAATNEMSPDTITTSKNVIQSTSVFNDRASPHPERGSIATDRGKRLDCGADDVAGQQKRDYAVVNAELWSETWDSHEICLVRR